MLVVAPGGLLRVNRGTNAIGLTDLLTFMSNAILKSRKQIFVMRKPSKFNVPGWNERAKELNARYREAMSHWNIGGRPRSGPLTQLKCRARAAFRHEMKFLRENEDQLHSHSMPSKLQRGECNDFWVKIKALSPKKESLLLSVGGTSGESNIANLWKDHFSAITNFVGSTDNRDQVKNSLRTVPGHHDVINVHELRQIVKGLKNNKAIGNDGIPSEVYKFASERLLTMMLIFLSGCMLTGKLPNSLMHVVIIPLLKCKSKDPADVNNYRPIAIATALSKVLEQLSRLARYLWTRQPIWFQASTWDRNGHFLH